MEKRKTERESKVISRMFMKLASSFRVPTKVAVAWSGRMNVWVQAKARECRRWHCPSLVDSTHVPLPLQCDCSITAKGEKDCAFTH